MKRVLVVVLLLIFSGCGYRSSGLYRKEQTVAVPVFRNDTLWRKLEDDLTREVVNQIAERTPYQLQDPDRSDLVIEGEIVNFNQPVLSEDRLDRVIRSSAKYTVRVKIRDRESGDVVRTGKKTFRAPFSGQRGESTVTARREAVERIGRWVTRLLEKSQW